MQMRQFLRRRRRVVPQRARLTRAELARARIAQRRTRQLFGVGALAALGAFALWWHDARMNGDKFARRLREAAAVDTDVDHIFDEPETRARVAALKGNLRSGYGLWGPYYELDPSLLRDDDDDGDGDADDDDDAAETEAKVRALKNKVRRAVGLQEEPDEDKPDEDKADET